MVSLRIERGYLVSEDMESEQHSGYLNSKWREVSSDRKESIISSQINQKKMGRKKKIVRMNCWLSSKFM